MPDLFGKLKSGAEKVAFEADKMARLNRVQGEVNQLKRQIESQYMQLGEMVYQHYVNQATESPDIGEICQKINDLKEQVDQKDQEVQRINAETFAAPGTPPPPPPAAEPAAERTTDASPIGTSAPAVEVTEAAPPPAPAAAGPQTKFCSNCGKEMPLAAKFCPDCGTKM